MADNQYPSDKQDKFMLRLPDGMRDRVKAAATENNRSMNAEIVSALEIVYPAPNRFDSALLLVRGCYDQLHLANTDEEQSMWSKELQRSLSELAHVVNEATVPTDPD